MGPFLFLKNLSPFYHGEQGRVKGETTGKKPPHFFVVFFLYLFIMGAFVIFEWNEEE